MNNTELIKKEIERLYNTDQNIHMNINFSHPKLKLKGVEGKLVGVYSNIFCVEEYDGKRTKIHSLQYADILLGHVEIVEMFGEKK